MPDAATLLKEDHRKVERLFARYKSEADPAIVEEICTELTVHSAIEEQVVYPRLAADVPDGEPLEREASHEHAEVKQLISRIQHMGFDNDGVGDVMARLEEGVTHHVEEEEKEVLPRMEAALGSEMTILGQRLEQAKEKEMARLGSASSHGPGQPGELIDLTRDELYQMAKEQEIEGRSHMSKRELIDALGRRG
jgi:hemerythrin superfamily protein